MDNSDGRLLLQENRCQSKTECSSLGVTKLADNFGDKDSLEKLNVLVIKKIYDEKAFQYFVECVKVITRHRVKAYVENAVHEEVKAKNLDELTANEYLVTFDHEKDEHKIDLIITIGGDGTILWALQYFQNRVSPPVITFDRGTLGFMCNFAITKCEEVITKIFQSIINKEPIYVETKFRIGCLIKSKDKENETPRRFLAINEFVVDRGPSPLVCKIDCFIEGQYLTTFEGDGVIVCTPNGSTAYQLSAGGPIVHQSVPSVVITPICPHSLATRPVVLPMDLNITLRISQDSRNNAWFSFDGINRIEVKKDDCIFVSKTEYHVPFITDGCKESLDTWLLRLRHLLGWNSKKFLDFPPKDAGHKDSTQTDSTLKH